MLTLFLCSISANEFGGIGGFIRLGFEFTGDKSELFSFLKVVVKTPQGSLVDTTDVQPNGYWIVPSCEYRELTVNVRGPQGLVFDPPTANIRFPFNDDVDFKILGFSASGTVEIEGSNGQSMVVSAPLTIQVKSTMGLIEESTQFDGAFSIGPLVPGDYAISIKEATVDPVKITISDKPINSLTLKVVDWLQSGEIVFGDGKKRALKLLVSGSTTKEIETDENGFFKISGLATGQYKITAVDSDITLAPTVFSINPTKLPTPLKINFEGVVVRGFVAYPDGTPLSDVFVSIDSSASAKTAEDGSFVLTPVRPSHKPHLSAKKDGYAFEIPVIDSIDSTVPSPITIKVIEAPIKGFTDCPTDLEIVELNKIIKADGYFSLTLPIDKAYTIRALSNCGFEETELKVKAPGNDISFRKVSAEVFGSVQCLDVCSPSIRVRIGEQECSVKLNGEFKLTGIEYGTYPITLSTPKNEIWKLSQERVVLSAKSTDIKQIAKQTAYTFSVTASHYMTVLIGDQQKQLNRGLNQIQTVSSIVKPLDCHIFSEVDLRQTDRVITESFRRSIKIVRDEDVEFEVTKDGKPLESLEFLQKESEIPTIEVSVKAPFFAVPSVVKTKVTDCANSEIAIQISRGVELCGHIIPAVEGVVVKTKDGHSTKTDSNGYYSLGAYPQATEIEAVMAGYDFKRSGDKFDFVAVKHSKIIITFSGAYTEGILLALSRADGFHKMHKVDSTTVEIEGLSDGSYFMRPLLKEYKFTPSQASFELKDGTEHKIHFDVERYQFGISGTVRRITGEPEPDVEIKAMYKSGDHQTCVTDAKGRFRIGGVTPNQTVKLFATATSTLPSELRISPSSIKVKMGSDEYTDVRFTTVRPPKSLDIMGHVMLPKEFLFDVAVLLTNSAGNTVERFMFQSKSSNLFHFTKLRHENHTLNIVELRPHTGITCQKHLIEPRLPHVTVDIDCDIKERVEVPTNTIPHISWPMTVGIVVMWILVFNISRIVSTVTRFIK